MLAQFEALLGRFRKLDIESAAREVAAASMPAVVARLSPVVSGMGQHQLRGYIHARARREVVRQAEARTKNDAIWNNRHVATLTRRAHKLVTEQLANRTDLGQARKLSAAA